MRLRTWSTALFLLAVLPFLASAPASQAGDHAYVGNKKCKGCHLKEYKSWEQTKMANTFDVLKPGERSEAKQAAGLDPAKDYSTDPACVKCHSTGYGEEGGFVDIETTPNHTGVGCEMCHGAGGTYIKAEHMSLKNKEYDKATIVAAGMVDTVSEAQCVGCHNSESPFVGDDFVFDFEAVKDTGTHDNFPLKYSH